MLNVTIKQLVRKGEQWLIDTSTTPHLDATVLLAWLLHWNVARLYAYEHKTVSPIIAGRYAWLIFMRRRGKPVAYSTGHKEFFSIDFYVNRHVLIPRPETELLVEYIISIAKTKNRQTIVDVGTGSGCIAIALKKNIPNATIYATDISKKALDVAARNATTIGADITILHGNCLAPLKSITVDIVVANLPYLPHRIPALKHEPAQALYASDDGLAIIKQLCADIAQRTQKPWLIVLEIDHRHGAALRKLIANTLPDYTIAIRPDWSGQDRYACLTRKD